MARFENYRRDKIYWFVTYLRLAEAISADPSLSAKNSDFKEYVDEFARAVKEMERKHHGWFYDKT